MAAKRKRKKRVSAPGRSSPPRAATPGTAPHRFRPRDSSELPRFAGPPTFLRLPVAEPPSVPEVDVLITGLPFDGGSSFRSGARFGPRAVREASSLSRGYSSALGIDIYDELRVADGGDVTLNPHDLHATLDTIADRAEAVARSGVVGGWVGGDQSVTLGVLRGIRRAKLKSLGLLHIDAHSNTTGPAWGQDVHHGSVLRHALQEGLVRADSVVQIGIRGPLSSPEDRDFPLREGFEVLGIDSVKWDLHSVISEVRKKIRTGHFYVSVDASALDPAYAPGVSVPSPGGMSTWELQQILRSLVGADIVGFDVVEICPPYDHGQTTSLVGVSVIQELLAAIADTRRSARPASSSRGRQVGGRMSP